MILVMVSYPIYNLYIYPVDYSSLYRYTFVGTLSLLLLNIVLVVELSYLNAKLQIILQKRGIMYIVISYLSFVPYNSNHLIANKLCTTIMYIVITSCSNWYSSLKSIIYRRCFYKLPTVYILQMYSIHYFI